MGVQSSSNIYQKIPCENDIEVVVGLYLTCLFGGVALILFLINAFHTWNTLVELFLTITFDILFLASAILPIILALYHRWFYKKWYGKQNSLIQGKILEISVESKNYLVEKAASELFDREWICFVTLRNMIWLGWIVFIPLLVITFAQSWVDIFFIYFLGILVVFIPGFFFARFTILKIIRWLLPYRFTLIQWVSQPSTSSNKAGTSIMHNIDNPGSETSIVGNITSIPQSDGPIGVYEDSDQEELLEEDIQDFLSKNPEVIELGLRFRNMEYPVGKGRIDILCMDENNQYLIIEVKRGRGFSDAAHQILRYRVDFNVRMNVPVRMMVIAESFDSNFRDIAFNEGIECQAFQKHPPIKKNARYCVHCGLANRKGSKNCVRCGNFIGAAEQSAEVKLSKPNIEKSDKIRFCSRCGYTNQRRAKYCVKCEKPIGWMAECLNDSERKTPKYIPPRTSGINPSFGVDDRTIQLRKELNNRYD